MTMTFSLHENFGFGETANQIETSHVSPRKTDEGKKADTAPPRLFANKIRVPRFEKTISLPRLNELLAKSSNQFGATLIAGRSGTGKTALAADYASQYETVAWYSIESADCDWDVFSNYLTASLLGENYNQEKFSETLSLIDESKQRAISRYLTGIFFELGKRRPRETPMLIVLDDLHHIFDCDWFNDFFNLLLYSLLPNTHLLLLCRTKPALPLWRLRSKQVLNVIDEKLLALNFEETEKLYENFGLSKEKAQKAYRDSFGRVSKLMFMVSSDVTESPPSEKAASLNP
jgi:LuxR family transcriptional regulator, maltose regulon positive regulatory protein